MHGGQVRRDTFVDRRGFMAAAGGGFAASGFGIPVRAGTREATFLVAHGAWSAGWAWKKMHPRPDQHYLTPGS
jgi:hypothetical protein